MVAAMVGLERARAGEANDNSVSLAQEYVKSWALLERAHRTLLETLKDDLDRSGDTGLTGAQALMLFNIGTGEATVGELRALGQLSSATASYNLKKLAEAGFILQERCAHDRRAVRVKLTAEGEEIRARVGALMTRHATTLEPAGAVCAQDLRLMNRTLGRLARFWADHVRFRL
jgi:DNA-binding MarR family transcriptional regulator